MGNHIPTPAPTNNFAFNYLNQGQDWTGDACGMEQSPIDIVPTETQTCNDNMKMQLYLTDHTLSDLKVQDLGNTLMAEGNFSKMVATDVAGNSYEFEAIQFHFHAPSEHTINGKHYDLELHIVHQMTPESAKNAKTSRNLAVLGVFFDLDTDLKATPNPFIEALKLHNVGSNISMNMNDLMEEHLTDGKTFYAYQGGLTTPPCTENANFYILDSAMKINRTQLEQFNLRWKDNINFANGHGNNRPTQPLNGRTVMKSNNCCVKRRSEEVFSKLMSQAESTLMTENTKKSSLDDLMFRRDIMFEDSAFGGMRTMSNTQGFIEATCTKTKPMV
jgi:carbonic anhydrase